MTASHPLALVLLIAVLIAGGAASWLVARLWAWWRK